MFPRPRCSSCRSSFSSCCGPFWFPIEPRGLDFPHATVHFFSVLAGIAWIPIATLWFGYGFGAITFVIFNAVFFIVTYNTLLGVSTIPRQTRNAAASLGAGRWAMLTEVLLPGALPNIVTGIRTGLGFAWRRCLPLPWLKAEIQRPECNFLEGTDNQRLQRELGGNIRSLGYRDRIVE